MIIINVLVTLVVIGVLLYMVNNYIPMDRKIKSIINIIVIIAVVLWLLSVFNIVEPGYLSSIKIGR